MTKRDLLVTGVVALICGGILVLFTDIEEPLLPSRRVDPAAVKRGPLNQPNPSRPESGAR